MDSETSVLVVDDEPVVRDVLARYLERGGFAVSAAADGLTAVQDFRDHGHDIVLLDLMLPGIDGVEVLRRIRETSKVPVIMLTAKGAETDRIAGLELGADDYVIKPFSPAEVVARVRAVLRRSSETAAAVSSAPLEFGELTVDPSTHEARRKNEVLELTPKEFDLLYLMASSPRTVFTRGDLLDQVWDVAFDGDPATVTVHIRRLREKIEADPSDPRHLITIWGVGYRFEP